MAERTIQLSQTQNLAFQLLNDPTIVDLLFGGGAGGAKSMLICIWMIMECRKYPGIRIGLGREELVRLEETTLITLFSKAHPLLGVGNHEFEYNSQKHNVTYINGSQIHGVGLSYEPRDPDYDRFGSAEYTHTVIEEVGEVSKKGLDVFTSRKNRFMNKEYGIVGKTVQTCNPTNNFIRQEYYEPYKALGMGRMQKWENGKVHLPQDPPDVFVTAYRAFLRSLVTDNPFADPNYIEELRRKPPAERKRLLDGNWDYLSADYMLFTDMTLDRSLRSVIEPGRKVMGVDISDGGKDATQATIMENGVATEVVEIPIDSESGIDPAEQVALGIIRIATKRKIKPDDIGIDGVGVGAGARVALRLKGWMIRVFIGGGSPTEDGYGCLRDEQYWKTSEDLKQNKIGIYVNCTQLTELRQDLKPHEYTNDNKVIKVTPKTPRGTGGRGKSIKEILGRSPDRGDSFVIARWVHSGSGDPSRNTSRIAL